MATSPSAGSKHSVGPNASSNSNNNNNANNISHNINNGNVSNSPSSPPRSAAMAVPNQGLKKKLESYIPQGLDISKTDETGFRPWSRESAEPLTGLSSQGNDGIRGFDDYSEGSDLGAEYLPGTHGRSSANYLHGKSISPPSQSQPRSGFQPSYPQPSYPSITSVTLGSSRSPLDMLSETGGDQYLPDEVAFTPALQSPTLGLSDAEWKSIPFSTRRKIKVALEQGSPVTLNSKDLPASLRSVPSTMWSAPASRASSLTSDESSLASSPTNGRQVPFSQRKRERAVTMYPWLEFNKPMPMSLDEKNPVSGSALSRSTSLSSSMSGSSAALQFLSRFGNEASTTFGSNTSTEADLGEQVGDYIIGKMIGYGSFSQVREANAIDTRTGKKIVRAVKVVQKANSTSNPDLLEKIQHEFDQEIAIWKTLDHPHILKLLSVEETDRATYCFTEKITGGTLFDAVRASRGNLDPRLAQKYLFQLGGALLYLHETMHVVHRDVKLENCLLEEAGNGEYKVILCDFGMSDYFEVKDGSGSDSSHNTPSEHPHHQNIIGPSETSSILNQYHHKDGKAPSTIHASNSTISIASCKTAHLSLGNGPPSPNETLSTASTSHFGSIPYASPELLSSSVPIFEPHVDVWAFGVVGFALHMGRLPWQHSFLPKLRTMILEGHWDQPGLEFKAGRDVRRILSGCLEKNVQRRLRFRDFMNDSFWWEP